MFLIWNSSGAFVQWSRSICAILVEGIMGKILRKYELGQVVREEMSFKDISYLELWPPSCSAQWNFLCNF